MIKNYTAFLMACALFLLSGVNATFAQSLTQSGFTSVLTPQYMPNNGSNQRLPVMFRATVTGGLTANTTYRFYTQAAIYSDIGGSNSGAGNPVLINSTGTTYSYSTGASTTTAGNYQTFTTDASGNFTGWFGIVNTGNERFNTGTVVYPTITIGNNTTGTVISRRALNESLTVLAFSASAGANNGSFLKGNTSNATAKNLVALYNNEDGTGRPLFISPVQSIGVTIASVISGFTTSAGGWNAIIPNNNANGVRRIEQRSVTTGDVIGCAKDADGSWPTGPVNTANPTAGATGLSIAPADASLTSCITCGLITVTATPGIINCPGGSTTVSVSATGGTAPYTGTGIFNVGAGTFNYNVTDANGCTGSTSITVTAVPDTTDPVIYLQGSALLPGVTGPTGTQSPYLLPSKPGIKITSLLSVNDLAGGYRMVGIPDGTGAFDNGNGTFTILMNHELPNNVGITRAHGSRGAFVSKWIVNKSDLSIVSGSDLMTQSYLWDVATQAFVPSTFAFGRFCSADLPPVSAFYNSATGLGTQARIFMNGEETGVDGKGVGHIATGPDAGKSYELPWLGKFAWENSVAAYGGGDKTIVAGLDDGTGGQVYMYVGTKTNTGTDIDKAGLNNGKLYGIKIVGLPLEVNGSVPAVGTRFEMFDQGFVQNKNGTDLNAESVAGGVTTFMRPEDGAWDPSHPNDFYFVTTNAFAAPTRLWRLRFDNIATPELGGTVEAVLDGTEGGRMYDNITIDKFGHVYLQEDVGNNAHIGKVFQYDIATDVVTEIAHHDQNRFLTGASNFLTQDEESSGITDVSEILGPGMFISSIQAHFTPQANAGEVVEGGQMIAIYNPYSFGNSTAPDTLRAYTDSAAAIVDLGTPATADNCSVASVTNNAPSIFPLGTTIVTWTVTDGSGNSASVDQVVIVADTTSPTITAPGPITVATNEACTATGVNLGTPTVEGGAATVTNDAPLAFPLGATTVTWTATDSSGNISTDTQLVTVIDSLAPVIVLMSNDSIPGVTGPSGTQSPYLLPSKPGIKITSLLSVNDMVGSYRMVGIPDGTGAFDNGNGTFTMLMNHELPNNVGITRAHGSRGAFVSKWIINKSDLSIVSGSDLMTQTYLWDTATHTFVAGTFAFGRFCSADLPAVSAFYNSATGLGTRERIFMDGEETGVEGKGMGHIVTGADAGKSYELPWLGKFAWENSVAAFGGGDKTIVAGLDDGTGGQVYIYVGTKTNSGTDIDKAGLNNGKLYGVKVVGLPLEVNGSVPAVGTRFEMFDHGFVQNKTGLALNTESVAAGVTTFMRPEDGAWDPSNPNDFYFVTTNAFAAPTRLWRMRFDNITTPELGGTIEAVLDGTEGGRMYDNITIDRRGHVYLQEDVGNNTHIGKVFQYNIATDSVFEIGHHDPKRFLTGAPNFLTQDEESSGITDVSEILGPGMFISAIQAHFTPQANPGEVVEGGQMIAIFNPYSFGVSTAKDTVFATTSDSVAIVDLGTPATADNCSVASVTNNAPATFPIGITHVLWTVTDGSGNTATVDQVVIVTVAPNQAPIITITSPANGSNFDANKTITLTADANDPDGNVVKVEFYYNGTKFMQDTTAPYGITANGVEAGIYAVTAIAYDNEGDSTISDTVIVNVIACTGSGSILGEGYTDIPGVNVSNLTSDPKYPNYPDIVANLSSFEYSSVGENYGGKLRGYICAPVTGYYRFYIASDEHSELWLSTDDQPVNIRRIAYLNNAVPFRSYTNYFSQKSAPILLLKGAKYYIETLHKEGTGADHLSVAWQIPGGAFEAPIQGSHLSPWGGSTPIVTARFGQSFEDAMRAVKGFSVIATPNPSQSFFTIKTASSSDQALTITITDVLGRVVERKQNIAANGVMQIGHNLLAGTYFVEVAQGDQKKRLKLIRQ